MLSINFFKKPKGINCAGLLTKNIFSRSFSSSAAPSMCRPDSHTGADDEKNKNTSHVVDKTLVLRHAAAMIFKLMSEHAADDNHSDNSNFKRKQQNVSFVLNEPEQLAKTANLSVSSYLNIVTKSLVGPELSFCPNMPKIVYNVHFSPKSHATDILSKYVMQSGPWQLDDIFNVVNMKISDKTHNVAYQHLDLIVEQFVDKLSEFELFEQCSNVMKTVETAYQLLVKCPDDEGKLDPLSNFSKGLNNFCSDDKKVESILRLLISPEKGIFNFERDLESEEIDPSLIDSDFSDKKKKDAEKRLNNAELSVTEKNFQNSFLTLLSDNNLFSAMRGGDYENVEDVLSPVVKNLQHFYTVCEELIKSSDEPNQKVTFGKVVEHINALWKACDDPKSSENSALLSKLKLDKDDIKDLQLKKEFACTFHAIMTRYVLILDKILINADLSVISQLLRLQEGCWSSFLNTETTQLPTIRTDIKRDFFTLNPTLPLMFGFWFLDKHKDQTEEKSLFQPKFFEEFARCFVKNSSMLDDSGLLKAAVKTKIYGVPDGNRRILYDFSMSQNLIDHVCKDEGVNPCFDLATLADYVDFKHGQNMQLYQTDISHASVRTSSDSINVMKFLDHIVAQTLVTKYLKQNMYKSLNILECHLYATLKDEKDPKSLDFKTSSLITIDYQNAKVLNHMYLSMKALENCSPVNVKSVFKSNFWQNLDTFDFTKKINLHPWDFSTVPHDMVNSDTLDVHVDSSTDQIKLTKKHFLAVEDDSIKDRYFHYPTVTEDTDLLLRDLGLHGLSEAELTDFLATQDTQELDTNKHIFSIKTLKDVDTNNKVLLKLVSNLESDLYTAPLNMYVGSTKHDYTRFAVDNVDQDIPDNKKIDPRPDDPDPDPDARLSEHMVVGLFLLAAGGIFEFIRSQTTVNKPKSKFGKFIQFFRRTFFRLVVGLSIVAFCYLIGVLADLW